MITTITAYDSRGKIVFRSTEPHDMSEKEIKQCLKEWQVDVKTNLIEITKTQFYDGNKAN